MNRPSQRPFPPARSAWRDRRTRRSEARAVRRLPQVEDEALALFSSERRTNEREDRFGAFPSEDLGFFLFEDRHRQEERCKLVAYALQTAMIGNRLSRSSAALHLNRIVSGIPDDLPLQRASSPKRL